MNKLKIKARLQEALVSLDNMHKPSYNKKAWRQNLVLCLREILEKINDK